MLTFVEKYKNNIHSQNGEDGIVKEIFRRLKVKTGTCCEFGANDGRHCSNSYALLENGWEGLLIEPNTSFHPALVQNTIGKNVTIKTDMVTPENVNELLDGWDFDMLSIDIDGNDFNVWEAYTGKPKVVIIEINSDFEPSQIIFSKGTSYEPMVVLGMNKGYFLLCHTGNLIFIDAKYKSKFPEVKDQHPIDNVNEYFNYSWVIR